MLCRVCSSPAQKKMNSEMALHFPGFANLGKPTVLIFPEVLICLDCGFAGFMVPKGELSNIKQIEKASGERP